MASSPWQRFIISIKAAQRMIEACERDLEIVRAALIGADDPGHRAACEAEEAELVAKVDELTERIERQREYNRERARKQYAARKEANEPGRLHREFVRQRAAERREREAADRRQARESAAERARQRRIELLQRRVARYRSLLETNPRYYRFQIGQAERELAMLRGVAGGASD